MSCTPRPPSLRTALGPGVHTTCANPKYLAWLALEHRLHSGDLLRGELMEFLWDRRVHHVAMTFVDGEPACVVLAAEYGQLMAFTRAKYRRQGLAQRTTRRLCQAHGLDLDDYNGAPGRRAQVSERFFNSLSVNFVR